MNPDTVIKLMFCGFVILVIAVVVGGNLFYKRLLLDTPGQYPRGKVAGKTKEQRNNLIILLFFLLVIILPGVYLFYKHFDNVLILCPLSVAPLFFLALTLFVYDNYRAATFNGQTRCCCFRSSFSELLQHRTRLFFDFSAPWNRFTTPLCSVARYVQEHLAWTDNPNTVFT